MMEKYSIWKVYFVLLIIFSFVGMLLGLSIAVFLYKSRISNILKDRIINIQTLANTIGSPFWIHQELLHIPGTVENFLSEMAETPGILFIRLVNTKTQIIEKSSDRKEVGKKIPDLPRFENKVLIREGKFSNQPIKELSVKSKAGDNLWMGVSLKNIQKEILLTVVIFSYSVIILMGALGFLTFTITHRFVIRPLVLLKNAFNKLKKEDYAARLGGVSGAEMQNVFWSFNQMVERLAQIRNREKELAKIKTEFVSIAAHQLRTPLAGIRWALKELLEENLGRLTKEQTALLRRTHQNNTRMTNLVTSLLNLAEIEEGRYLYQPVPVQIENLFQPIIDSFQEEIKTKKIEFKFIKLEKELPQVKADVEKMKLVIQNLLDNAVKYSLPNGKITISLRLAGEQIEFSIKDTGIGIPKDQQEKIFTKFFRTAQAKKIETEGSGLGLVIVKNIIEAHGGKVWFESKENKGTTFYFQLPIVTASSYS